MTMVYTMLRFDNLFMNDKYLKFLRSKVYLCSYGGKWCVKILAGDIHSVCGSL